ncbi:uncharacterized protein N7511_008904 [Penicillium nucicola]|uniref:uncharacterized protein n=1 Tax=Penicillium nucicola TaxID=1850975 RepID=UPI002544EDC0|nr:uncharacterized protein N7511_008904 [Penicillium nucicola]KAJ5747208.1 hypothetical protein N7511_008904 [Penicillium nucicola]
MRVLPRGAGRAEPSMLLLLLLIFAIAAQVAAVPADDTSTDTTDAARTTDDPSTTDSQTTAATTTKSSSSSTSTSTTKETSTTTSSSSTSTTMDTTTTSSSSSSTTSDTSTSTSSSSTTTTSSSSSTTTTSSSSTTTGAAIVTVPPIANAPYMQESAAPEGTVFIAVGAALGLIGLTLLAWRAMIAWSVNRSVRRAAIIHASESKRLLRGSRKKRSVPYTAAPAADVSLDKLGAATRASYKSNRVPTASFFSPTAGGGAHGSHASLNATGSTGNRGSTYLPAGYYAAAGGSNPAVGSGEVPYSPTAGLSSPSLPPTGVYNDSHVQRHSHVGASTSSLNLNQAPQGRAPSAYLEDLFESHVPSHNSGSDRR